MSWVFFEDGILTHLALNCWKGIWQNFTTRFESEIWSSGSPVIYFFLLKKMYQTFLNRIEQIELKFTFY